MTKITASLLCAALLFGLSGCSGENGGKSGNGKEPADTESSESQTETAVDANAGPGIDYLAGYATFEVTSTDLVGGVWSDAISNTSAGENLAPQLSWAPVEGAEEYIIYMVDTTASCWMHCKAEGITDTNLPQGWATPDQYVGPYPPSGETHTYDIYVVAVRAPIGKVKGAFDGQNPKFDVVIKTLDTDEVGNGDNIIAYGRISGEFKSIEY